MPDSSSTAGRASSERSAATSAPSAEAVFDLMLQLASSHGTAFVLVTHDASLAARCGRQMRLDQGRLSALAELV